MEDFGPAVLRSLDEVSPLRKLDRRLRRRAAPTHGDARVVWQVGRGADAHLDLDCVVRPEVPTLRPLAAEDDFLRRCRDL